MIVYILIIMRRDFRMALLTISDLQMMTDRPFIDPQVPGRSPDSLFLDSGFQVPKRNCPKPGPLRRRSDLDTIGPKSPMDRVL